MIVILLPGKVNYKELKMKKAALHNLGCKVNAYETEAMQQLLEEAGYEIVPFQETADVYVINTCSVTSMADRKSRQMLHRARKMNPDAIVVGAGCYIQTQMEEAIADLSIDIIIGNNEKSQLVERIRRLEEERSIPSADGQRNAADRFVPDINRPGVTFEELPLSQTEEHTRAFIKVQDGCNQFCSYCIIPYARGRVRSRELEQCIAEIRRLADKGFQEIVLTGIHLSSYGVDTGDSLLHLIQEVHKVEGVRRIRLGSLEPKIVTEEFARTLSQMEKICPHFHLSLQSGCNATLKRMNRKYTAEEYKRGCELLRKYFAHPAITTDVIAGFPGETEEEFAETRRFLEDIHFYEMHIFKYSVRKGTRAAVMPMQVPETVKTARSAELIALGSRMSEEFRSWYPGKEAEVLFEEETTLQGERMYTGYTREYVRVAVRSDENLTNRIRICRIEKKLTDEIYEVCLL